MAGSSSDRAEAQVTLVRRFLHCMATEQWDAMASCVAAEVLRIGPWADRYRGRQSYRDFLEATITRLPGYRMDVARVWSNGDLACAELAETIDVDGRARRTDEALTFEFDGDGLISRVAVFLQQGYFVDEGPPQPGG